MNSDAVAGVVIGYGGVATKRHNVGFNKSTREIPECRKEIPSNETSVSGDERNETVQ